jgi:hypothetical protein
MSKLNLESDENTHTNINNSSYHNPNSIFLIFQEITGIHAENRTTLPLINNYTIEGSIIYYLILL